VLLTLPESCHFDFRELTHYCDLILVSVAQGHLREAYTTCSSTLTQLGETVPETVTPEMVGSMIPETLNMYTEVYDDDWLGKKMEDSTLCNAMKFYSIILTTAHFIKPSHMVAYFICKMVQLSLRHGVCQYTPQALMILSSIVIRFDNAEFIR